MSDLISRQAAIDAMNTRLEDIKLTWRGKVKKGEIAMYLDMRGVIETLPSAQPERKTGKWIDETFKPWGLVYHPYKCDQCGEHSEADSNFCPNCGAKMDGGEIDAID